MRIPIYEPYLNGNESKYIQEAVESTWVSSRGKFVDQFEAMCADYVGRKFASSCSNGTVALDLALKAVEIQPGDEIIVASFTYVASVNCILYNQAKPVFMDVVDGHWNVTLEEIQKQCTDDTKAIILSNTYGSLPDIASIETFCKSKGIKLIEDAAESLGSSQNGKMSGSFGDVSTFSFFGNKTITSGEGGMVLTDDEEIYDRISQLKNQGNSKTVRYYHDVLGYNYRMTNLQAAIGVAQFEQLDNILAKKQQIVDWYHELVDERVAFQSHLDGVVSSNWMVAADFGDEATKNKVVEAMDNNEIETRPFFIPINRMPYINIEADLPVTDRIANTGLCLPSFPGLTREQLEKIADTINKAL